MLSVYTLDQSCQWDTIVRSFKEYDVYWLSGYVKAFQLHGDGEPLLFFYEDRVSRGINVVMRRDIAKDERFAGKIPEGEVFDFATPYGYGGWIIEGGCNGQLFDEYKNWAEEHSIVSEFVRFHPMIHNHEQCSPFYDIDKLGPVVHMDLLSPQTIWENITSKNRNMIRKAVKNGIQIYNGRFPEIYEQFRVIYDQTMLKDDADKYYFFEPEFYELVLNALPYNAQVFWAEKNKTVVAAAILLTANRRMNYHLSGSLREYGSLAPTNLLLYEAAMWGSENGYKTLYLGGGVGSGEDGLFRFKRSFYRGSLNSYFVGTKIYDMSLYNNLTNMRSHVVESAFFPLYRAR